MWLPVQGSWHSSSRIFCYGCAASIKHPAVHSIRGCALSRSPLATRSQTGFAIRFLCAAGVIHTLFYAAASGQEACCTDAVIIATSVLQRHEPVMQQRMLVAVARAANRLQASDAPAEKGSGRLMGPIACQLAANFLPGMLEDIDGL